VIAFFGDQEFRNGKMHAPAIAYRIEE